MQAQKTQPTVNVINGKTRFWIVAIIVALLFVVSLYINNVIKAYSVQSISAGTPVLSQADLEQKYGLRVNLVALTAAGGMVDVRLKITDGEKSRLLLAEKGNFPILVTEQGVRLIAPEETTSQEIQFVTGGNLFIIYPNSSNAIKPGTPVTILFGTTAVERIKVK